MPHKPPRQRFIAGAKCPRCGLLDKIVIDTAADQRRCVSCGFSERRAGDPSPTLEEPPTRVSRALARRLDTPAEIVTLVDPADSSPGKTD